MELRPQVFVVDGHRICRSVVEQILAQALDEVGVPYRANHLIAACEADLLVGRGLIVEVDGPSHSRIAKRVADVRKETRWRALGYEVLRLLASAIRGDLATCVRTITRR